jgi:hypothetical protein
MYAVFIGKAVQTVNPPAGSVDSSKINYPLTTFSSTGIDDNATSTAITIDSSQNVGIGTASPSVKLEVSNDIAIRGGSDRRITLGSAGTIDANDSNHLRADGTNLKFNSAGGLEFWTNNSERMRIDSSGNVGIGTTTIPEVLTVDKSSNGGEYIFEQNGSERMRIDSSGNLLLGKTTLSSTTPGINFFGIGAIEIIRNIASGGACMLLNRQGSDGTLILFQQANVTEGSISVSGSTVSYNGFTGTHWSRFTDNSKPTILKGTVLESLDEMCDWYNLEFDVTTQDADGNDVTTPQKIPHVLVEGQSVGDTVTYNHEGTDVQATIVKETDIKHMKSKVSDTVDAKNVYGVFSAYDLDGEGYNDFYVASVGSFVVRIKQGETVAKGDLLQSNGDGTAKVQTDDNVKSSSFAKVLSTTVIETYEDGSYLVPCSLMC